MALGDNLPALLPTPAGTTWYVATTGNDTTGTGAIGAPWATLQKAIDTGFGASAADETILLRGGNYGTAGSTVHTISGKNGTAAQPWKIASYPGETAVVRGTFKTVDCDYGILQDIHFEGAAAGVETEPVVTIRQACNFIQMIGCEVRNSGTHNAGLYVGGGANRDILILRSWIHDNGNVAVDTNHNNHQGIYWQQGWGHIIDCLLTDNVAYGIQFYNTADTDVVTTGCVAYNNYRGYLINVTPGSPSRIVIRNSIAYANTDCGFDQYSQRPTVFEVHDCLSYGNASGNTSRQFRWEDAPPTSSNLRLGDPLFADAAGDDFTIGVGSDAIDQGTAEWAWPTDFDGDQRADPPDLGLHQFGAVGGGGGTGEFGGTPVLDDFNRADADPISGGLWTNPIFTGDTTLKIVGNQATSTGPSWGDGYWNPDTFQDVEAYLQWVSGAGSLELYARLVGLDGSPSGYALLTDGSGYTLSVITNGGYSTIDSATFTINPGDWVGISCKGDQIQGWHRITGGDWTEMVAATDGTHASDGRIGLSLINATMRVDNFGGGDAVVTSQTATVAADTTLGSVSLHQGTTGKAAKVLADTTLVAGADETIAAPVEFYAISSDPDMMPQFAVDLDFTTSLTSAVRVWENVSDRVREIHMRVYRQTELDAFQVGELNVVLANSDRALEPGYDGSPHYPGVVPRRPVRYRTFWEGIEYERFNGFVRAMPFGWPGQVDAVVTFQCADWGVLLNRDQVTIDGWPEELAHVRIGRVLTAIGVPSSLQILDQSDAMVAAIPALAEGAEPTVVNALEHCELAARSDGGYLFRSRHGQIVFHNRYHRRDVLGSTLGTLGDGDGEIPYRPELVGQQDDSRLWNRAAVLTAAGEREEYENATARAQSWGSRRDDQATLLARPGDAFARASEFVWRYSTPRNRYPAVDLQMVAREGVSLTPVLAAEVGSRFRVLRRPPGGGDAIDQEVHVEGISEDVTVRDSTYRVRLDVSPADPALDTWIVGTSALGTDTYNGL